MPGEGLESWPLSQYPYIKIKISESHQSGHKEQQLTLLLSAAVILSSASTAKPKTIKNGKEEGDELSTTFRVGQELFEKFCLIQREALIKNDEEDNKGEEKQRIIILKKFILNLCQQIRVGKTDTWKYRISSKIAPWGYFFQPHFQKKIYLQKCN